MDERHKRALTQNNVLLVQEMMVDATFMSHFMADGILIDTHIEEINSKPTKAEKAMCFLGILRRRGPKAMPVFIAALIQTHQDHIAEKVEPALFTQINAQIQRHGGVTINPPHIIAQETTRPNIDEVDEPELDLNEEDGDSFININVRKVDTNSPAFRKILKDKHVYALKQKSRGRAVIINNEMFHNSKRDREGTNFDMLNLDGLLTALGYTTEVHSDKTAKEMMDIIAKESKNKDHAESDSFILALFSHGAQGVVYGTDFKPVSVEEIKKAFDGIHCRALAGKPKLIIIQACQGRKATEGVPRADASEEEEEEELSLRSALKRISIGDGDQQDAVPWQPGTAWGGGSSGAGGEGGEMGENLGGGEMAHEKGDMCVAYSTVSGYKSWRLPDKGSWFIRTLVKVFMHYAKTEHVIELLTRVRRAVSEKKTNHSVGGLNVQMTQNDDTLIKKWYLFPGYSPPQQ